MDRQFYHLAQESISHCCWYVARQLAKDQDKLARCSAVGDTGCSQATYLPLQHALPTPSAVLYGTAAFSAFSPARNQILQHTVRSLERTVWGRTEGWLESMWYQLIITKCPFNSIQSVCHKNYTLPVSNDECLAFIPLWRMYWTLWTWSIVVIGLVDWSRAQGLDAGHEGRQRMKLPINQIQIDFFLFKLILTSWVCVCVSACVY